VGDDGDIAEIRARVHARASQRYRGFQEDTGRVGITLPGL